MKRYLEWSVMMTAVLLTSCARDGFGPRGYDGWGPGMMHYGFGYGYGGMFMGLLFFILIAALVYFIIQALNAKGRPPVPPESPLDILKKRYAKGEITKEEYEKIKKDLEG